MDSGVRKAGPQRARDHPSKKQSKGKHMTSTLAARTLIRESLRASSARVRVLGRSDSWFIAKRDSELSGLIEQSQQLYELVPGNMRTVLSGPRAWILRKEPRSDSDYPFVAQRAPFLAHRGKRGLAHLPPSLRKGMCRGE
jgi:hypothetical protein